MTTRSMLVKAMPRPLKAALRGLQRKLAPPAAPPDPYRQATMAGALARAVRNGLDPRTVIDVGAAYGTPALYETFPDRKHLFIEPLVEFQPLLERIQQRLVDCDVVFAAAGSAPGTAVIHVHPDLVGSSFYREHEDSNVNGVERTIPVVSLDSLCMERAAQGPYLIKVDTQGAEASVLRGATRILADTQYVILEVSLFNFFEGGLPFVDCVKFMKDLGFVPYDFFDAHYRPLDQAMSQVDIAFVREDSAFRKDHYYATAEQRAEQNRAFYSQFQRLLDAASVDSGQRTR